MIRNPKYVYGPNNLQVPANINFGDFILDKLMLQGNKLALINGATDDRISYAEIAQQSMNFAVSLTRMGVRKGDTIGLFSENRQEYLGAVIGVACAGAIVTTINTAYVKGELLHAMNISKPKYIICSPFTYKTHVKTLKSLKFLKKVIVFGQDKFPDALLYNEMSLERCSMIENVSYEEFMSVEVTGQTDTLFIMYSSGTTGLPKGVMISHLNVLTACSQPAVYDTTVMSLSISPWYHAMGLVGALILLSVGRTGVYFPKFEMDLYLKAIEKYKIVVLTVVPPVLVAVLKHPPKYDLSSVKFISCGAAPLHKDTVKDVTSRFPNVQGVYQGYGATELTLAATIYRYDELKTLRIGSVGNVAANTVIKVVDLETRKPLGPNTRGEICVKGQILMKGYLGQKAGDDLDEEGFYKTGDIGYYDEDGYFYIVDRLKELIKYKGYQVPPAELEAVLLQHSSIKEAAVIGVADRSAGEVPLAFVVKQPGKELTEKEVKEFVAERLSNPKHLRGGVRFIDNIPKSASGKLLRKELRNMLKATKSHL